MSGLVVTLVSIADGLPVVESVNGIPVEVSSDGRGIPVYYHTTRGLPVNTTGGGGGGPTATFRLTESSDRRVTETGDPRVVE